MPKILFMVENHHFESSGQLDTTLDGDDGNYHSYFVNQHGEQWIFTYNRKEDMVYIQSGDLGWKTSFGLQHLRNHVFNTEEKLWLDACIHAIGVGELKQYI